MTLSWDDVNARCRGWTTHLLRPEERRELARQPDAGALRLQFERSGWIPAAAGPLDTMGLETILRRVAARRLGALARWCGPRRVAALALVFDDEDRRSLRSLVRGAAGGVSTARRLSDTMPTPGLPLRALETLAREDAIPRMAALLAAWGHPFAPAAGAAGAGREPDLAGFEIVLAQAFAARVAAAGDRRLRPHIRLQTDLANVTTALLLAGEPGPAPISTPFVAGGSATLAAACQAAAATGNAAHAGRLLEGSLAGTPLGRALHEAGSDPTRLERAGLALRIALARAEARRDPLGPAVTLEYALRVRAELLALRRIVWAMALSGPRAGIEVELEGAA